MKTKQLLILLLSCLLCLNLLAGCGNQTTEQTASGNTDIDTTENSTGETVCAAHIDENKDDYCDICDEVLQIVCTDHNDTNNDGNCDICNEFMGTVCWEHADDNTDGYCDYCDEFLGFVCPGHTDADADSYCDTCGEFC